MSSEAVYALVFSPHPADPDFGVGGTAAKWVREGKDVIYVICTNGDKGSNNPDISAEEMAKIREKEQLEAAEIIGVKDVIFLKHPDLGLEDLKVSDLKKEILKLFLTYRPEVVMTCDYQSPRYFSAPDHRVLGRAVLDAIWPTVLAPNNIRDLLAQGLKMHQAKELFLWGNPEPNYYSDISDTYDIKMKAVNCHQSQIGPQGANPDFPKMLVESIKNTGKVIGCEYAEAFYRLEVMQRL
jgi:LmbE family N-acetylglucosaminyl deacetylase